MTYYNQTMAKIYTGGVWNDNRPDIPKSGPGSTLSNTAAIRNFLDNDLDRLGIATITDLGCGDLNWMKNTSIPTNSSISYRGVDAAKELIDQHNQVEPWAQFEACDFVNELPSDSFRRADLVLVRDVIMHLKSEDIITFFRHLKVFYQFKYIFLTSHNTGKPLESVLDKFHYRKVDLTQEPFCFDPKQCTAVTEEPAFDRKMLLFSKQVFDEVVGAIGAQEQQIPKIVHQIWVGDRPVPPAYLANHKEWKRLLPADWEVRLWTNDDITAANFQLYDLIQSLSRPIYKADVMRYEILFKHGGFYIDMDMKALRSIENLPYVAGRPSVIVSREDTRSSEPFVIGFMAAIPNHAIFKTIVQDLRADSAARLEREPPNVSTGPHFFDRHVDQRQTDVWVLPCSCFYSLHFMDRNRIATHAAPSHAYGLHEWGKNW